MATTYNENGGAVNGSNLEYTFSWPYLKTEDVKVALNGTTQASTKYTVSTSPTKITFNNTSIDSSVQESTGAPKTGVTVRVFRDTDVDSAQAVYAAGSSIRAGDLNNNQDQVLYALQEEQNQPEMLTNADINPAAEIEVSKFKDGAARQVLQTDATGTGVEWTSNVDVPGTLDVTGAATLDSTLAVTGAVTVSSTVDGRDIAADGTKLDGIAVGAKGDQTNAEIRAAVEAATDSNVFTDADHTKLNAIEASATADQTDAEIRAAVEAASDSNVFTDADHSKLNAIEASATADQTDAEIRAAVEAATDSNVFTDADHTKLNAIAAGAEVNVQSDWNSSSGDNQILNKPTLVSGVNDLSDVDTTGVANNKILKYESSSSKWKIADDSGGGGSALTVVDESTTLTTGATKLTFAGSGVTATEPSSDEITVTIPGSSGGASAFTGLSDTPGSMGSAGQHLKVNSSGNALEFTAAPSGTTNLSNTANGTSLTVESSSGNNTALPAATTSAWGVMTDEDKTKLDGIETSATADQTGAQIKTAYEGEADTNAFTDADHTKLDGIATSATATPTTTRGDIIYRAASADARLAKGTAGQYLKIGANDPEWADVVGAVADGCIFENDQTISNNYTIASGKGAHSVGPITVNATVTVNGNWVVS